MNHTLPLYRVIATLLSRQRGLANLFLDSGKESKAALQRKSDVEDELQELMAEHLPSGSGFNAGCQLLTAESDSSVYSFPGRLVFQADFYMQNGGWAKHQVHVTPTWEGFSLVVTGTDIEGESEYISECFNDVLNRYVPYGAAPSNEYRVTWSIDVSANGAFEAARDVAHTYFREGIGEGDVFTVLDTGSGITTEIDLAEQIRV